MKRYLVLYLATLLSMLPLDMLFLRVLAKDYFNSQVGQLLTKEPNVPAAVLFYLLYVAGIVIFVSATATSWKSTLLYGALFGFMCYMTFELTNRVLVNDWTWGVVIVDLAWGTFVTAVVATLGWLAAEWLAPLAAR